MKQCKRCNKKIESDDPSVTVGSIVDEIEGSGYYHADCWFSKFTKNESKKLGFRED